MKALIFQGIEKVQYETVPDPEIVHEQDVIVQVSHCAICGSDLHPFHGREIGLDVGTVMGHEFCGEIIETGKNVKEFFKGDKVVSSFSTNCGECYYCKIGLTSRCIHGQLFGWLSNGKGLHGGQAEFVRVPFADGTLLKYPTNLKPELALLAGDILSTGYYCAEQAQIQKDGTYAVIGCGPVGLMAIIAAKQLGAGMVFAIDWIEERLSKATDFGAIPVNFKKQDAIREILSFSKNRGADGVMEAVGNESAAQLAFDLVRPGGIISTVGVHTGSSFPFSPVQAYDKNITYKIGRCPARYFMDRSFNLLSGNQYDIGSIITHKLPLKDGTLAYSIFDNKKDHCIKVILNP